MKKMMHKRLALVGENTVEKNVHEAIKDTVMRRLRNLMLLLSLMVSCAPSTRQDHSLGMEWTDKGGELLEAAKQGNLAKVTHLLDEGAAIETTDYNDEDEYDDSAYRPLHHAAEQGNLGVVRELVARGAAINAPTFTKARTPLHYACMAGHLEVVQYLKDHGADMGKADLNGGTPLHYAARAGCLPIVQYFEEIGVDMYAPDKDSVTPLHSAAASGDVALVKYLTEVVYNNKIDQRDNIYMTPLHFAALTGQAKVVAYLVKADASIINLQDSYGDTALHLAASEGYEEVVKYLLAAKADVTLKNARNYTALMRAKRNPHSPVVKLLEEATPGQAVGHKRHNSAITSSAQPPSTRSKRVTWK